MNSPHYQLSPGGVPSLPAMVLRPLNAWSAHGPALQRYSHRSGELIAYAYKTLQPVVLRAAPADGNVCLIFTTHIAAVAPGPGCCPAATYWYFGLASGFKLQVKRTGRLRLLVYSLSSAELPLLIQQAGESFDAHELLSGRQHAAGRKIPPAVQQLVTRLSTPAALQPCSALLAEAYALEMLAHQLSYASPLQAVMPAVAPAHVHKLRTAYNYIHENYVQPPTIAQLSRIAGLNECTLKKDFKLMYGSTVYEMVISLRMAEARRMLTAGAMVYEAAMAVGYKNPQHFTVAYKRFFKQLPGSIAK